MLRGKLFFLRASYDAFRQAIPLLGNVFCLWASYDDFGQVLLGKLSGIRVIMTLRASKCGFKQDILFSGGL